MKESLLHSLLELAHATSQNLGFAHLNDVHVSYGEETITETNLLELRRRHPTIITLNTFGKKKESRIGADWEWHIIGRRRKFCMRVQAKRLQRDDKLKIPHMVKASGKQQIDLLIADAKHNHLQPVYCIYSAEGQRDHWTAQPAVDGLVNFEYGCLLASAHTIKAKMPKSLAEIEKQSIPWHYLVERRRYIGAKISHIPGSDGRFIQLVMPSGSIRSEAADECATESNVTMEFPTLDELNAQKRPEREIEGLTEADDPEYERRRSEGEYLERGIGRLVEIDVREFSERRPWEDGCDE